MVSLRLDQAAQRVVPLTTFTTPVLPADGKIAGSTGVVKVVKGTTR